MKGQAIYIILMILVYSFAMYKVQDTVAAGTKTLNKALEVRHANDY